MAEIRVSKAAARHVRRGHPWIWERGVASVEGAPQSGDSVELTTGKHRLGFGFYDPASPIRARRVWGAERPSREWAAALIDRALAFRATARTLRDTDAMRLLHGEADGASGLVIDRYGPVATLRFDGDAATAFWMPHLEVIFARLESVGVRTMYRRGHGVVYGEDAPDELVVSEDEARFEVDLELGQKTGLFLDQRPNRRAVRGLAAGARVLNLCCYTGGFSVHAALGGARSVTSVDLAAPAIEACRRNFERSGVANDAHEFIAADVFEFLAEKRRGRSYDLVICDPPSFAPRRSAVAKAMRAYTALNKLAISAVKRGGVLLTASCSSHINREQFAEAVGQGARRARRGIQIIDTGGPGADHPSRPGFPEGDYLKVLTLFSAR